MEDNDYVDNSVFLRLIENSIFTEKQIQIIYNISKKEKRPFNISSGAYFREVKQSKSKIYKLIYSIILLELLNILDHNQLLIMTSIVEQLKQLQNNHKDYHMKDLKPVMNVIEEMIIKLVKL